MKKMSFAKGVPDMIVLEKFTPEVTNVDDDSVAWRYFDIPKFLYLITQRRLYFARSDLLGDPFEGAPPKAVHEVVRNSSEEVVNILNADQDDPKKTDVDHFVKDIFQTLRKKTHVNCWHLNEFESAAMWTIYGQAAGLAVKSRVRALRKVIREDMILGKVRYVDHNTGSFAKDTNIYELFFLKRKSFAFENELRILKIDDLPLGKDAPSGYDLHVDLNDLIDELYISPRFPNWYLDVIEGIMETFGIKQSLKKSEMDVLPIA